MKIAIFASGTGTNFAAILKSIESKKMTNSNQSLASLEVIEHVNLQYCTLFI